MSINAEILGTDSGEDAEGSDDSSHNISSQIINRPDILAALQERDHFAMVQNLPPEVKRRIKALKKLQLESTNIEARFFEEVHRLECRYHDLYSPLYSKREEIVNGAYEPNDDECDFPSDEEIDIEDQEENRIPGGGEAKKQVEIKGAAITEESKETGIPNFWLTIFKNVALLSDMIQPHDEPILQHLVDLKVVFLPENPIGFRLEFEFSPNEYFTNTHLVKEYEMKCSPDESDPFSYEGPEIFKCKGCTIDWCKGKNVTLRTLKKKQKHKSRSTSRTITKTVQNDSFFNFFTPPQIPDDQVADLDEDTQAILTSDFEIGHYIRERIVPRAILYFTGEALEDEDDFDDEEDEDEEEDECENDNEKDNEAVGKKFFENGLDKNTRLVGDNTGKSE